METSNSIINEMNNKGIFAKNTFTYTEYVEQLLSFQTFVLDKAFGKENHPVYRIEDAMAKSKQDAVKYDLLETAEYAACIKSLQEIGKELNISLSGHNAEDRVNKLLHKYVDRPDFSNYQGIYLQDEYYDSEIDNLIVTKDGLLLLEIKRVKYDVKFDATGRFYHGKDCSFEEIPLGEKMKLKRRMLKAALEKAIRSKGHHINLSIESRIVFHNMGEKNLKINDFYHDEKWLKSNQLTYFVNGYESPYPYSEEELQIINECLSEMETYKKPFNVSVDLVQIKNDFAAFCSMVENKKAEAIELQVQTELEQKKYTNREKVNEVKKMLAFNIFRHTLKFAGAAGFVVAGMMINTIGKVK